MKVLHIANWYPSPEKPFDALWIARHVRALEEHTESYVFHIKVSPSDRWSWCDRQTIPGQHQLLMEVPTSRWRIIEIFTFLLVCYAFLFRVKVSDYNLVNFHIAYPLLTYAALVKKIIRKPIVITEHWSGYHFNFGIENVDKTNRIRRIFSYQLPVIAVSRALLKDIYDFSKETDFPQYVVPNIVETASFCYQIASKRDNTFFMVGLWKLPKDPLLVIRAIHRVLDKHPTVRLRIGGYGPLERNIKQLIKKLKLENIVSFIGALDKAAIAKEMNTAVGYIHCSMYETFSVVCAESICCGTPVVASRVGGICEFINESNGVLVKENSISQWELSLIDYIEKANDYDREEIAKNAEKKFSAKNVGQAYYETLQEIYLRHSYSEHNKDI